jgi:peptidyl-prolyl cis-trans isomerase SurA
MLLALPPAHAVEPVSGAEPVRTVPAALDPQKQVAVIDAVVAVVNDDVITRRELDDKLEAVVRQLQRQGTPLPDREVLEKQMLERMITDMLQAQFARESGVRVDDAQLDMAIARIAQQNGFPSLATFRAKLEAEGVDFGRFREEVRGEIISTRLREREVESKLVIGDSEVDNYLDNKAKMGGAEQELHLAHILVVVPEQASADRIQAARDKAEQALAQLRGGADFAQVAAGSSDAKDALNGGDLGWRPSDRIPPLFLGALQELQPGHATEVLRSPSGFHLLKLVDRRSGSAPVVITQTHARHILIKTSEIVSDSEAKKRIMEIKARIETGADFAEQAKRYSQDGSAQQGGDLGFFTKSSMVKPFADAAFALQPGQVSDVVETQFGFHIIKLAERKDIAFSEATPNIREFLTAQKRDERQQAFVSDVKNKSKIEVLF